MSRPLADRSGTAWQVVDTHTHLDRLDDPAAAARAARAGGVGWMLTVGTSADSSARAVELARSEAGVAACVGIHPARAAGWTDAEWDQVRNLAPDAVAVGETGFDQYRPGGPGVAQQHELFVRHCDLAREQDLPLVIHTRACEQPTLDALAEHADGLEVVMHCFSMPEHLDELLERGYWISFAGNATYPSAGNLRDAAARVPAGRLLVETDAPYLTPVPHRGSTNEPVLVRHTLECLAEARGQEPAALAAQVVDNADRLFARAGLGQALGQEQDAGASLHP